MVGKRGINHQCIKIGDQPTNWNIDGNRMANHDYFYEDDF